MNKDKALLMAIEFMETLTIDVGIKIWNEKHRKEAIQACKEALEPTVAELNDEYLRDTHVEGLSTNSKANEIIKTQQPTKEEILGKVFDAVYAQYPKKEWQGLTAEEITSLEYDHVSYETFDEGEYGTEINIYTKEFARAIEAKLKEKNG